MRALRRNRHCCKRFIATRQRLQHTNTAIYTFNTQNNATLLSNDSHPVTYLDLSSPRPTPAPRISEKLSWKVDKFILKIRAQ